MFSALEIFFGNALYKFTFYLLSTWMSGWVNQLVNVLRKTETANVV